MHRIPTVRLALTSLIALAGLAAADTVELKDGSTLRGEIISTEGGQVRVRIVLKSGAYGSLTISKKDVKAVRFDESQEDDAEGPAGGADDDPLSGGGLGSTQTRPRAKAAGGSTEKLSPENQAGKRTIYVLDHSGSMAIGQRWEQAVRQTERLVRRLEPGAPFDVMLFSAHIRSLFTKDNTSFRSKTSPERVAAALRADPPELRAGTHFVRALRRAVSRRPKKVVLITDGVGTLGGPFATEDAMRVVTQARAQGVPVDVLAAHDGTFALNPKVEDLGAAKSFLQRLARAGGGVFLPLRNLSPESLPVARKAFRPTSGVPDGTQARLRFEVLSVLERKVASEGMLPARFRVRVFDPVLARLKTPDVWEYGGAALVEIHGPGGVKLLRLEREGEWLQTQQEVMVSGKTRPGGIVRPERVVVPGVTRIVYRRGSKTFPVLFGRRSRSPDRAPCEPNWIEVGQETIKINGRDVPLPGRR
jgi:Mg-chelatase subunit ChlD